MPFKPVPERMGEALGKRPQRSPTPPPKPNFGLQGKAPHSPQQQPRVVNIPIRIERTDESERAHSPSASANRDPQLEKSKANSTLPGSLSLSSSPAHPISHPLNQSPGPHVVNIPIHVENSHSESNSGNGVSTSKEPASGKQSKQIAANDPLGLIKEIDSETAKFEQEVDQFNGDYLDRDYRYLDEMLTRSMLKLDNIESNGREDVRAARKSSLARIDKCIRYLESKANKPQQPPINEGEQEPSSQDDPSSIHSKANNQESTNMDEGNNENVQENTRENIHENTNENIPEETQGDTKEEDMGDTEKEEGNDNESKMDVEGVC